MTKANGAASERTQFDAVFEQIAGEILAELPSYDAMSEAGIEWLRRNLYYNVPGGKLNRGLSVVASFKTLKPEHSEEDLRRANILGWCVELLQAFFLVSDDIMDGSKTRRGQPCWYKLEGVGMVAINDAFILEAIIYKLLKTYFRKDSYYVDLLELFHEVSYQTELGQMMDLITAPEGDVDLSRFSMAKYKWIIKYKTAFYSFYLPVALGLHMCGVTDPASFDAARSVLLPLGEYFQAQDDYLDCFGTPEVIGKIGTDIEDNKCGWLINKALMICTPEQRKENYGQKDPATVEKVKQVYRELDMPAIFAKYEEDSYREINQLIAGIDPAVLNPKILTDFMAKIYKRTK